jgi:hypothetical protein
MDFGLDTFLSWQTALFACGIYAVVFVLRRLVEFFYKKAKYQEWWKLTLTLFPGVLGALAGVFLTAFPYPEVLTNGTGRGVYGLVIGLASGVIYRIVKRIIKQKFPQAFEEKKE